MVVLAHDLIYVEQLWRVRAAVETLETRTKGLAAAIVVTGRAQAKKLAAEEARHYPRFRLQVGAGTIRQLESADKRPVRESNLLLQPRRARRPEPLGRRVLSLLPRTASSRRLGSRTHDTPLSQKSARTAQDNS